MLDISRRIAVISALVEEDTAQSLTYAALECRLTLEYLCYERFKLWHSYLSSDDLKNWQPKHVVKQISEDIDENIIRGFTVSISSHSSVDKQLKTKEYYESLDYIPLGHQSELNLNKMHSLWHGLANVALHIPVPAISWGELEIYGNKENIRNKVETTVEYLSGLRGNLFMSGVIGEVYSFKCFICDTSIKKPVKYLMSSPTLVNCINPKCNESYLIELDGKEQEFKITRRTIKFSCIGCNGDLDVPGNVFRELKLDQQLDLRCPSCNASSTVIMRPHMKKNKD
ncbi:hypothetical protein [Nitrosomonas supralitoralis]|uniref:Uncharacterized protein n=1 Tax=Nitrosomonas supralitoralis TaxID=2116706 RepID=A0A2P7NRI9_9PROT|nr:hypothetical protein [Nitrosomonas supralitoralis]PSJ16080.1 hypothetical protein C7H79_15485 [Nitrosomonas supralitoralis]